MLVLTRKLDEAIIIGDNIEIKIVQIRGSGDAAQVRIGISAPKGVPVLRKEVYSQVREENLKAALQGAAGSARRVTAVHGATRVERGTGKKLLDEE